MRRSFFSIIIPTLNEESCIGKLLEQLLKDHSDAEFIIVDANSKDNTKKIVSSFHKKNIRFIRSFKKNVCYQRNLGADKARGDYLVFLDADVILPHNFLFKLHQKILSHSVDFATCKLDYQSNHLFDQITKTITNITVQFMLSIGNPMMTGACMIFRRDVFKDIGGFDEKIVHAEDLEIVKRAASQRYKGRYFNDPFYYYSLRRIKREGRIRLYTKYTYSFFYNLLIGPIRKPIFTYEMGGHVHEK